MTNNNTPVIRRARLKAKTAQLIDMKFPCPWVVDPTTYEIGSPVVYIHNNWANRVCDVRGHGWMCYKENGNEMLNALGDFIASADPQTVHALYEDHEKLNLALIDLKIAVQEAVKLLRIREPSHAAMEAVAQLLQKAIEA